MGVSGRAAKLGREPAAGHPKTAEAKIAQLMSGAMDRNAFRAWHKQHVRELLPVKADFFVALSAASDPDARPLARQLLGKLAPAVRNAWFGVIAQEVLDRLPAPEPAAPPGG